jgi:hypothetical protein
MPCPYVVRFFYSTMSSSNGMTNDDKVVSRVNFKFEFRNPKQTTSPDFCSRKTPRQQRRLLSGVTLGCVRFYGVIRSGRVKLTNGEDGDAKFSYKHVEVRVIGGDHCSTMASCCQCNQGIVLKISPLVYIPTMSIADFSN